MIGLFTRASVALVASLALAASSTSEPETICRLRLGIGFGCVGDESVGPQNAADLFDIYGMSAAKIGTEAASGYIQRFTCIRLMLGKQALPATYFGSLEVATQSGPLRVRLVEIRSGARAPMLWIPDPYLVGECPRFTPTVGEGVPPDHH